MLKVRASVIIVSHNHRAHLGACLRSLCENHRPEDEIILVDNASTDGSADYVEVAFPQVTVIRNSVNLGFARANNHAAQKARGNYLAFLNPDTTVTSGWLDELVTALDADPHAGLATSKILLLTDPEKINTAGNNVHITGITMCRGMGLGRHELSKPEEISAISGAAFAIRRELFEALGGFDPDFFLYMEDTDLSWRALLAGYRCLYVPDSIVRHDYTLRFGNQKVYHQERNRYLMLIKSLRFSTLLILTPVLLLAEAIVWGFILLCERASYKQKLSAYRWVIQNWTSILQKRDITQSQRKITDRQIIKKSGFKLDFDQVDQGKVGALSNLVFNPLFYGLRALALLLVWK